MRETYSFGTYRSISCNFFFIRFHYLFLQLEWAKGTPLPSLCDSVKRFLGWFVRGGSEGGEKIRVRLCALRPCVRDKACEAYSPSVSSQSSDSTSLSAQLQLSPRVLRRLRTGQVSASHPRSVRHICPRHPGGSEVKFGTSRILIDARFFSNCWMLFSCRWCSRGCRFGCCWWWRLRSKIKVAERDNRLCVKWHVKRMWIFLCVYIIFVQQTVFHVLCTVLSCHYLRILYFNGVLVSLCKSLIPHLIHNKT